MTLTHEQNAQMVVRIVSVKRQFNKLGTKANIPPNLMMEYMRLARELKDLAASESVYLKLQKDLEGFARANQLPVIK